MLNFWNRENKWDGKQKLVVQKRPDLVQKHYFACPPPEGKTNVGNKGHRWMEGLVVVVVGRAER